MRKIIYVIMLVILATTVSAQESNGSSGGSGFSDIEFNQTIEVGNITHKIFSAVNNSIRGIYHIETTNNSVKTNTIYNRNDNNTYPKAIYFNDKLHVVWQGWVEFPPQAPDLNTTEPQHNVYYGVYNGSDWDSRVIYFKLNYNNEDSGLEFTENNGELELRFHDSVLNKQVLTVLDKDEDFERTFEREVNLQQNKTKISFTTKNKTVEVFNVDVLEAQDRIDEAKEVVLKLEGNGTQEVRVNVSDYGEPKQVIVDTESVDFTYNNTTGIVNFTTHFSQRSVYLSYEEPPSSSNPSPSGGSSSSGGGSKKSSIKISKEEECKLGNVTIINKDNDCKEICLDSIDQLEEYEGYVGTNSCAVNPLITQEIKEEPEQPEPEKPIVQNTKEKEEEGGSDGLIWFLAILGGIVVIAVIIYIAFIKDVSNAEGLSERVK